MFIDDQVTLADSSVIVQYLDEERHPDRYRLLPDGIAERARARWFEEYADTRIADAIVWGVFRRAVLDPGIWGKPRDLETIARMMQHDLPPVMDYLERQLPASGFLFDPARIGLADVSIAVTSAISVSRDSVLMPHAGPLPRPSSIACWRNRR